jgi:hypothetical protein
MRNFIMAGDRQVFFESRVDPVREAEKILSPIDTGSTDIFILFGYTTRHVLSKLLELTSQKEPGPFILCVDPGFTMLEILKESAPEIVSHPRIRFFKVEEPASLTGFIEEIFYASGRHYPFHYKLLKNSSITGNWRTEYESAEKMTALCFRTLLSNLLVMDRFKHLWIHNLVRNISRISDGTSRFWSLSGMEGKYKGKTVLIVNAGPSLDTLHETIRKLRNRVVIMAVDTAVRNLVLAGIEPDIIVSLDSQLHNYQDLYGTKTGKACLVMEVTASHKIPDVFEGPIFLFYTKKVLPGPQGDRDIIEPHYRLFTEKFRNTSGIQTGGSVSATALDLALLCGFSRIVMVSLDLAFTDQRLYCRSTYVDSLRLKATYRFSPYDTAIGRYVVFQGDRSVEGGDGRSVRTNAVMEGYRRWFSEAAKLLKGRLFFIGGVPPGEVISEKELLESPVEGEQVSPEYLALEPRDDFNRPRILGECETWLNFKRSARFSGYLANKLGYNKN